MTCRDILYACQELMYLMDCRNDIFRSCFLEVLGHISWQCVASMVCNVHVMSCFAKTCCNVVGLLDERKELTNDMVDATAGVIAEWTTILPAVPAMYTSPACMVC